MSRIVVALLITLCVAAGAAVYVVSHYVQEQQKALRQINRDIAQEQSAIRVLRAEWSYLIQPARLAQLAERHLQLGPTIPSQLGQPRDIAMRASETAPLPMPPATLAADDALDQSASKIDDLLERVDSAQPPLPAAVELAKETLPGHLPPLPARSSLGAVPAGGEQ